MTDRAAQILGNRSPEEAVADLLQSLSLEQIGQRRFRGATAPNNRGRAFGGHVMAQALNAASLTVGPGLIAHSMHSHFLHAADSNTPIIYQVESLRDGRSFQTRCVVARQAERDIFALTASFQRDEDGFDHQSMMPPSPPPAAGIDMLELYSRGGYAEGEEVAREWAAVDVRIMGDSLEGLEPDLVRPARQRAWLKISAALPDDAATQLLAFTWASDITLLPAALTPHTVKTEGMLIASLDHTIWFHRPFRADEWWLYDQESPSAENGRGLSIGKVFTCDGRLVATTAQQGIIRPPRRTHATAT